MIQTRCPVPKPKMQLESASTFLKTPFIGEGGQIYYPRVGSRKKVTTAVYLRNWKAYPKVKKEFREQMGTFDKVFPDLTVIEERRSISFYMGYDHSSFTVGGPFGKNIIKTQNFSTPSQAVVAFNTTGVYLESLYNNGFKAPFIQRTTCGNVELVYPLPQLPKYDGGNWGFPKSNDLYLKQMFTTLIGPIRYTKEDKGQIYYLDNGENTILEFRKDSVVGRTFESKISTDGVRLSFIIAQAVDAIIEQLG